jgi:ABC-type antimicrobial peptide transport system permease subunit
VEDAFAGSSFVRRVSTGALTLFGVAALVLAAVGIYGVVAYSVTQRTREIGVRMTLGAEGKQVRRLMVRQAVVPVAVGAIVGLAGSLALGRVMSGLLFEMSASDPLTLVAVTSVLTGIALVASYIPALRASRLDPVKALRFD